MVRLIVALGLILLLAGCATTPRYSATTVREPRTTDRVRVEVMVVETEADATNFLLTSLGLNARTDSLTTITGIVDAEQLRNGLTVLQQEPGVAIRRFPTLIVADGERREADCQKPMRYASEYTDPTVDTWPTPKTWTTRGVGMKWSCEAEIEGDKVTIKTDPEDARFEGYVEYKSYRVKNGKESVHVIKQPLFSKRSVSTRLTLKNGEAVLLGGLSREDKVRREGRQETRKINQIFFLTAEIVDANGNIVGPPSWGPIQKNGAQDGRPTKSPSN